MTDSKVEKVPITIQETVKAKILFNARGPAIIKTLLTNNITTLEEGIETKMSRKTRLEQRVGSKQKICEKSDTALSVATSALEEHDAHRRILEGALFAAEKKQVDAKHDYDDEKKELDALEHGLSFDEKSLAEKKNGKNLLDALLETQMKDRPLGKQHNNSAEDYREAVACKIPSLEFLYDAKKVPVLSSLVFLRLNGVEEAVGSWNTPLAILRKTLTSILYPDIVPQREESLSPTSKAHARAEEIFIEAQEAERVQEQNRLVKRKREMETLRADSDSHETPAKKKMKIKGESPDYAAAKARARSFLTEEAFAAIFCEETECDGKNDDEGDGYDNGCDGGEYDDEYDEEEKDPEGIDVHDE